MLPKSTLITPILELTVRVAQAAWEHPDFANRLPAGKIKTVDQGKK